MKDVDGDSVEAEDDVNDDDDDDDDDDVDDDDDAEDDVVGNDVDNRDEEERVEVSPTDGTANKSQIRAAKSTNMKGKKITITS